MKLPHAALALAVGAPLALTAAAQNAAHRDTPTASTRTQSTLEIPDSPQQVRAWGLQPEEWVRYRELMQGPLGTLSPQLDPLTALGIEARTDAERRRYAELQVRFEAQRVEKLLTYQRAYDAAWQRLHPNLRPLSLPAPPMPTAATPGDPNRLALFVRTDCPPCDRKVQQLQAAGTPVDVYVVGSRQDDARIRQWAAQAGVEPARVRARALTLNHDGGRWLSLGLPGALPALVRQVDGRWQRQ